MNQYINNVDKSKELEALYEETKRLQTELDRLNKKLSGVTGNDKPLVDIVRRDTIIEGISRNSEKIVRAFGRGSLLELAQKDAIENEAAKNVMENKIFEMIKAGTTVTLADPVFKQNANGNYDASFSVKWTADPLLVLSDLERYFKVDQNQINKLVIDSEPRSMKKHYSTALFTELVKKKIVIRVHFAGQERDVTIAAGRNCFVTCTGFGESQYQWMYKSDGKTLMQGEVVSFVNLSEAAIKNSANIKASILVAERER